MFNLERKGLSSVLQVALLTALSIVALSLVWGYVKDLSNDFNSQLSPTVDCISQKSRVLNACMNQDNKIEVDLDVAIGEEINKLDLSFGADSFSCGRFCETCALDGSGTKTIYLSSSENVNQLTASINGCLAQTVQVSSC